MAQGALLAPVQPGGRAPGRDARGSRWACPSRPRAPAPRTSRRPRLGGGPKVPLCAIENFRAGHAIGAAFRGRRRTGSAPGDRAPFLPHV